MKIWVVLFGCLFCLFTATLASAPVALPTAVPSADGKSTVTVSFVVSGRVDLGEVVKLASGVTYIYNKDKTRVLVIMDVAAENAWKVRDVVRQNGWEMKRG